MNVEPYSDDEIADARTHLSCDDESDRCHYHDVAHWLATVDALQARLAAAEAAANTAKVAADLFRERAEKAEARAERAVGMLGDARKCVSLLNGGTGYYDGWLSRCDELIASRPEGEVRGAGPVRCWDRDLCCGDDLCKFQNGETLPPNTYCGHDDKKEVRDGR